MSTERKNPSPHGPVVVVEIGSDWIKMARFVRSRGALGVSDLFIEKTDLAGANLSKTVSKTFAPSHLAGSTVLACIPRQMVNIRMLELPSTDPAEIADMVELQAGKQTPYSRDEVVVDYRLVPDGRPGYTRVMLAIAQNSLLRERFNQIEELGLEVQRMSVSSEGVANWCAAAVAGGPDRTAVVLDVDSFYSDLAVVAKGALVYTKSIVIGANHLLADYDRWKEKLAREAKQALEACRSEMGELQCDEVILSGAASRIKDFDRFLTESLAVPCRNVDALAQVKEWPLKPSLKDAAFSAVSLTPLIGIALAPSSADFNLCPETVRMRRNLVAKARSLTTLGMLVMTAFFSVSAYATAKYYVEKHRLDRLHAVFSSVQPVVKHVEAMQEIIKAVNKRQNPKLAAINVLEGVQKLVPEEALLDAVDVDLGLLQVTLRGAAVSRQEIRTLINNLEQSPLFRDVKEIGTTTMDANGKFRFQIGAAVEKP
jgi:Tfp pilus assembly PilM family ATPase